MSDDTDVTARLADMLVRCGIERGVLGRIDADNVARILLPIVREIADQRAAEELEAAAESQDCWCEVGDDYGVTCRRHGEMADDLRARAAALRGEAGGK